jgi:aminomuconate-semialdehyde/2-hydroxymuconate-6-semialdehyde dehydrogenase
MDLSIPHALRNYIGGRFCLPQNGSYIKSINPATGELLCHVPESDELDVQDAVEAARQAFPAWSRTTPEERFNLLNLIAFLITEHCEALALAETLDSGKPLWLSRQNDIPRSAANFRFFATAAMQFSSESHTRGQQEINYTLRQPLGVVGCISPLNMPMYLFTWKIAPALAAGNCVIAKPSELTPVTAYLIGCICHEAGLPAGVLNIIHGTGSNCGEIIVKHPEVKAVSFSGSTLVGRRIASLAAPLFKKVTMELGGKNPNLIFADCNWEKMLDTTIRSSFSNQGQMALGGSRILVEQSIYQRFKDDFVQRTAELQTGNPLDRKNDLGAIASQEQFESIMESIYLAKREGGIVLHGGKAIQPEAPCTDGYFIEPTILENLGPDTRTNMEEIFGPVVTLQPFDTEAEALQIANASSYGLAATIWTENISRASRLSAQLECGFVWINGWTQRDLRTPFGGVKDSGVGREGGWETLRFFTEAKNVCISV